jgi:uncharacterized protein
MIDNDIKTEKGGERRTSDAAKDFRTIAFRLAAFIVLLALFVVLGLQNSQGLEVSRTELPIAGLPDALQGLRIAEIADLHSSRFGDGQSQLIDTIRKFKPDLILIAGDFIDGVTPDGEPCAELVKGLVPLAPVYRVRGNHEYYLDADTASAFDARMAASGAILLDNQSVALSRNGQGYLLAGMNDVTKYASDPRRTRANLQQFDMETTIGFMADIQAGLPAGDFPLKIMLCHQPQFWQVWQEAGYDIALCGHLHGWLVRIPGIGGLIRPRPVLYFPEEDSGLYNKQGLLEYISRGLDTQKRLGNLRLNNKPELSLFEVVGK